MGQESLFVIPESTMTKNILPDLQDNPTSPLFLTNTQKETKTSVSRTQRSTQPFVMLKLRFSFRRPSWYIERMRSSWTIMSLQCVIWKWDKREKSRYSSVHWWTEIAVWPQNEKILLSLLQSYIQSGMRVIRRLLPTVLNGHSSNQQTSRWLCFKI